MYQLLYTIPPNTHTNMHNMLSLFFFLGGLRVTNPPIRLMCPTSVCPSTFSFPDSNSKMVCPIEFKLDREIDHHHSKVPFEIGTILCVRLSVSCLFVCPSTIPFPDSNSKTVCPIEFKLDRDIDHNHS